MFLVGDIAWHDEESEANPQQEAVDGQEHAVVKENAGPSDQGCDYAERGSDGGGDELGDVSNTNNVGVGPDVEPSEQTEDESNKRVSRELLRVNKAVKVV